MPRSLATRLQLLTASLCLIALLLPAAHLTAAQSAASCALAPVTLPLFGATPAAEIVATPTASAGAPEPTEAEMRDAAAGIVACVNARSQALRYAIFTDRYLASLFVGDGHADQPAFERMIATGEVPAGDAWQLDNVSDIEPLPDGQVAVTLRLSARTRQVADRLVLAWDAEQGAWLIDDVVAIDNIPATPAP